MVETSSSLLLRLTNSTDAEAWRQFTCLYTPLLRAWLHRCSVNHPDADDLVQQILLTVAQEMPHFAYDRAKGSFRGWLRSVLINRVRAHRRTQLANLTAAAGADVLEQLEDSESDLSRTWDREHDQHVVRQLLQRVQPDFEAATWEAFRLLVLEDQKPEAVATRLNLSLDAVYAAKYRVLKRLREEYRGLLD